MNKNFYIFRHGLATKDLTGYGDQTLTAGILKEGIPAIQKLAEYLKNIPTDANYTSLIPRCLETVKIVSKITGKKFIPDTRLNEFYNETIEQLSARIRSLVKDIEQSPAQSIAIATHGGVIAALIHLIIDNNHQFNEDDLLDYPHPAGLVIIKDGTVTMLNFD